VAIHESQPYITSKWTCAKCDCVFTHYIHEWIKSLRVCLYKWDIPYACKTTLKRIFMTWISNLYACVWRDFFFFWHVVCLCATNNLYVHLYSYSPCVIQYLFLCVQECMCMYSCIYKLMRMHMYIHAHRV